jgi:hypothetical protein
MKKTLYVALGMLALASVAGAQGVTESFTNLNSIGNPVDPATNNSTISGGLFTTAFFSPDATIEVANPFLPGTGKYLSLSSAVDRQIILSIPDVTGSDTKTFLAFAFRLDGLSGTAANNNTDVVRINDAPGGGGNLFGVVVRENVLRLAATNGWPSTPAIVSDISTLTQGQWYAFALIMNNSTTAGAASAEFYAINTTTGATSAIATASGVTNTGIGNLNRIEFGATYRDGTPSETGAQISIDEVSLWPGSAFASDAAFLSAVGALYSAGASSVSDWSLY